MSIGTLFDKIKHLRLSDESKKIERDDTKLNDLSLLESSTPQFKTSFVESMMMMEDEEEEEKEEEEEENDNRNLKRFILDFKDMFSMMTDESTRNLEDLPSDDEVNTDDLDIPIEPTVFESNENKHIRARNFIVGEDDEEEEEEEEEKEEEEEEGKKTDDIVPIVSDSSAVSSVAVKSTSSDISSKNDTLSLLSRGQSDEPNMMTSLNSIGSSSNSNSSMSQQQNPFVTSTTTNSNNNLMSKAPSILKKALISLYQIVDPSKLPKLDAILEKYRTNEKVYVERICRKYGTDVRVESQLATLRQALTTFLSGTTSANPSTSIPTSVSSSPFASLTSGDSSPFASLTSKDSSSFDVSTASSTQSPFASTNTSSTSLMSSSNMSSKDHSILKQALIPLYQIVDPSKLPKLDAILQKYRTNENVYIERIYRKYGADVRVQSQLATLRQALSTFMSGSGGNISSSGWGNPSTVSSSNMGNNNGGWGSTSAASSNSMGNSGWNTSTTPAMGGDSSGWGTASTVSSNNNMMGGSNSGWNTSTTPSMGGDSTGWGNLSTVSSNNNMMGGSNSGWNTSTTPSMGGGSTGWGNLGGGTSSSFSSGGGGGWGNTPSSNLGSGMSSNNASPQNAMKAIRLAMINLYTKVDPSKIRKLDAALLKYQGRLNEYVTRVMQKYGTRPDVQEQLKQLTNAVSMLRTGTTTMGSMNSGMNLGMNSGMNSFGGASTGW